MDKELNNVFPESALTLLSVKNAQLAHAVNIEHMLRALLLNIRTALIREGNPELSDEIAQAMKNIPMIEDALS